MTARRARTAALLAAALAAAAGLAGADDGDPGKPFGARDAMKRQTAPVAREEVTFPTEDGLVIAGSYVGAGAAPGGGALLLVHGEGGTRAAWESLVTRLFEHKVPFLAIDLRGHGKSATQAGKDLAPAVAKADAGLFTAAAGDLRAASKFLVETKKHDPKRIGILAERGLGSAAAIRVASGKDATVAALMVMTPSIVVPGYDTLADALAFPGPMPFTILCGAEDWDPPEKKKNPRHLLYSVKYNRDAPKDTPLELRVARRRGVPPRIRSFAETGAKGARAFDRVKNLDAWVAAWWARELGTLPNAVLYDGIVDWVGDYADPGWKGGTPLPNGGGTDVRVLRWGRRLMIGGPLAPDATKIAIRVRWARGGMETGTFVDVSYPSGAVDANARQKTGRRAAPIEVTAIVMEPDPNPQPEGAAPPQASFEAEVWLPPLPPGGDYALHVSCGVFRMAGGAGDDAAVDPARYETWTVVPDLAPEPDPPPPADEKEEPKRPPR